MSTEQLQPCLANVMTMTATQAVRYALACALQVCKHRRFRAWARDWLNGKDRTATAARAMQYMVARARNTERREDVFRALRIAWWACRAAGEFGDYVHDNSLQRGWVIASVEELHARAVAEGLTPQMAQLNAEWALSFTDEMEVAP